MKELKGDRLLFVDKDRVRQERSVRQKEFGVVGEEEASYMRAEGNPHSRTS